MSVHPRPIFLMLSKLLPRTIMYLTDSVGWEVHFWNCGNPVHSTGHLPVCGFHADEMSTLSTCRNATYFPDSLCLSVIVAFSYFCRSYVCVWKVHKLLQKASHNRSVAKTKCNERSSRSHSVFRLQLTGRNSLTEETCTGRVAVVSSSNSWSTNKTVLRECKPPAMPKFQRTVIQDSNPDY